MSKATFISSEKGRATSQGVALFFMAELPKSALGYIRATRVKRNPTRHEQLLYDALCERQFHFKFQPYFYDKHTLYIPDFKITTNCNKLIVEVDGASHN